MLPGVDVTVYVTIALEPELDGACQITVAWALPADATTLVGAAGATGVGVLETGVTALDAADAGLLPTLFFAITTKVYAVPFVRPVTVAERADAAADTEMLPGEDFTV
jgi:hypothetical protein